MQPSTRCDQPFEINPCRFTGLRVALAGIRASTITAWGDLSQERSARETVYEGYSRRVRTLPVWKASVMSLRGPENSSEVHTEQLWD